MSIQTRTRYFRENGNVYKESVVFSNGAVISVTNPASSDADADSWRSTVVEATEAEFNAQTAEQQTALDNFNASVKANAIAIQGEYYDELVSAGLTKFAASQYPYVHADRNANNSNNSNNPNN
jgi:phage gp45-like